MIKDLFSPIKTINREKKKKNTTEQVLTLIIASITFAIAIILISIKTEMLQNLYLTGILSAITYFILAPIGAFIYNLTLKIIANKGTYRDSFVAVTQTALILATGLLITSILLLIPQIGVLLALAVMFFTVIIGFSIFIRAMTTLTEANTIQVLTILAIVIVGLTIATQTILTIELLNETMNQGMQTIPTQDAMIGSTPDTANIINTQ